MAYRLAHFSDFHWSASDKEYELGLALVDNAIREGADHFAITGDLVESGQMEVVADFMKAMSRRGFGTADRLSIIPGNHDIFPISKRAFPPLSRPSAIWERFAELTAKTRKGKNADELFENCPYPYGKVLGRGIVLVGMDSTPNGQYSPFRWAEGELTEEARDVAGVFLEDHAEASHRLLLIHHHPWMENSEGGEWMEQNFTAPKPEVVWDWLRESGATFVFCGHVHSKDAISKRFIGKSCRVLRAGTAGGVDDEFGNGGKRRIYHLVVLGPRGKVSIKACCFRDSQLTAPRKTLSGRKSKKRKWRSRPEW